MQDKHDEDVRRPGLKTQIPQRSSPAGRPAEWLRIQTDRLFRFTLTVSYAAVQANRSRRVSAPRAFGPRTKKSYKDKSRRPSRSSVSCRMLKRKPSQCARLKGRGLLRPRPRAAYVFNNHIETADKKKVSGDYTKQKVSVNMRSLV